jgi:RNA recognition motif-containing protein
MAKRLFIGGLSYSTTSDELRELFSKIGEVKTADVITDKFTNQGKGFGFVEFANDADADKAIKELNGTDLGGRNIVVNVARPREERSSGGYDDRRGSGSRRY